MTQYQNIICPSPEGIISCNAKRFIELNFDHLPAHGQLGFGFFVDVFLQNVTADGANFTTFKVAPGITNVAMLALGRTLENM